MSHTPLRALLALTILFPLAGAQGLFRELRGPSRFPRGAVHVVASGGGAPFTSLQAAIDAAGEGETVLVRSGLYEGFTLAGRSLAVVAEEGALVAFEPGASVRVLDLAPGQRATLRGLGTTGSGAPLLEAQDDQGLLWIEDCRFRSPWLDTPSAGRLTDCAQVVVVECSFEGGDSETADVHGLSVESSSLWMYDSSVTTGEHFGTVPAPGLFGGMRGTDGTSALAARGSSLFASGCTLTGGSAASFHCPYGGGLMNPGGAGPGLALEDSDAQTLGCAIASGTGYEILLVVCTPMLGAPVELVGSTHEVLSGSAHHLSAPATAREGETVELVLGGLEGELAFLHDTDSPSPTAFPGIVGPLLTLSPTQILALGLLPAGGALGAEIALGSLAPGLASAVSYPQGIFLGGPSASYAGEPSAVLVLDASLPAAFPDCDANGIDDLADIAAGAPDCNANGIPDACDLAQGTSADCDLDGVPDECNDVLAVASLAPSVPAGITFFGEACGLSGDTAIVSLDAADPAHQAIYLYLRDPVLGWPATETHRLLSSDPGDSVGGGRIAGDTIVSVVFGATNGPLVWVRDPVLGWPTTETLALDTSDPDDHTQVYYGIDEQTIVLDGMDDGVKSVFVYDRNQDGSWPTTETAILRPNGSFTYFSQLAVDGDVIAVSHHELREIYVFERSPGGAWPTSETAVLEGDAGPWSDLFAYTLDVEGDAIVAGAPRDNGLVWRSGAAYVFRRGPAGWSLEAKVKASAPAVDEWFGSSVALQGDTLVVGAQFHDGAQPNSGAAYLFRRQGTAWTEENSFAPASLSLNAGFAKDRSLGLDGGTLVIGADRDSTPAQEGSVTLFELFDADGNGVLDACE